MSALSRPLTSSASSAAASTSAPRRVDHPCAVMQQRELRCRDHVTSRRQFRRVHGEHIAPSTQLVQLDLRHPERLALCSCEVRVGDEHRAVDRAQPLDDQAADHRRTYDPDRAAPVADRRANVEGGAARPPPPIAAHPVASPEHVLGAHHDGGEGELGHRQRVGRRRGRDGDAVVVDRWRHHVPHAARCMGHQLQRRHRGQHRRVESWRQPGSEQHLHRCERRLVPLCQRLERRCGARLQDVCNGRQAFAGRAVEQCAGEYGWHEHGNGRRSHLYPSPICVAAVQALALARWAS